ncbi:hypothetical protein MMC29_004717, partial [Sticta canariensis]|nr:hypothetical protein [Sticta canariensis]
MAAWPSGPASDRDMVLSCNGVLAALRAAGAGDLQESNLSNGICISSRVGTVQQLQHCACRLEVIQAGGIPAVAGVLKQGWGKAAQPAIRALQALCQGPSGGCDAEAVLQ